MATIILSGIVCDHTCLGFSPGDDSFDFLFGPAFGNLAGHPFTLVQNASDWSLTINGITRNFPLADITPASPALGYPSGTMQFLEVFTNNPFGVGFEQEYLCPTPGVPEPATWALLMLGFIAVAIRRQMQWAR